MLLVLRQSINFEVIYTYHTFYNDSYVINQTEGFLFVLCNVSGSILLDPFDPDMFGTLRIIVIRNLYCLIANLLATHAETIGWVGSGYSVASREKECHNLEVT